MLLKAKFIACLICCGLLLSLALPSISAQDTPPQLPLEGSYQVGVHPLLLTDETRPHRTLQVFVWFPATIAKDAKPPYPPDTSGAPYPLIIYSHGNGAAPTEAAGNIMQLVSQGYVVAGIEHRDTTDKWLSFVNRPLDILFLLNQLDSMKDDSVVSTIDLNNVGTWGASYGGYTAIATAGARVDPTHFADWCPTYADDPNNKTNFDSCSLLSNWDKLVSYHDQFDPPDVTDDPLWAATTDSRIKAIFVVAPCFAQMFGEDGLASVTVPAFMADGTADHTCPYAIDAAYYYQHLGSPNRYLVSLKDRDHSGSFSEGNLIPEYVTAFFGLYLKGETDDAQYLTPDTASAYKDVTLESQLETSP